MGYKIRGHGLRLAYFGPGLIYRTKGHSRTIVFLISYFTSFIVYFCPAIAAHIVGIKRVKELKAEC